MSNFRRRGLKFVEKSVEFMYHPYVRKASRFARLALETINLTEKNNPVSIAVGAMSIVDSIVEGFELPIPTRIEQWAKKAGLVENYGHLGIIIVSTGLVEKSKCKVVCIDEGSSVREMKFDFGSLYYVESTETGVYFENELDKILGYFYTTPDFPYELLFDEMWKKFAGGIYLSISKTDDDAFSSRSLRLNKLNTNNLFYVSEEPDIDQFVRELSAFRQEGISRSYMLAGEPGTGKTSFAINAAKALGGRIVKVVPDVARQMGSAEFEFVVKNLAPDVILFDDFDRATDDAEQMLFTIENLKQQFPQIVIFATVNYFETLDPAIKRPGRFDETLWFNLPDVKEREKVLKHYLDMRGVQYSKQNLKALAKKTNGLSPAYLVELCTRIYRKGWDSVDKSLEEFSKTLESSFLLEKDM